MSNHLPGPCVTCGRLMRPHGAPHWLRHGAPHPARHGQCEECAAAWLDTRRAVTAEYGAGTVPAQPETWPYRPPCADDPDTFFPDPHDDETSAYAIRTCIACPLRAQCLALALHIEDSLPHRLRCGIWAGTSPRERRALHEHATAIRARAAVQESAA